MFKMNKQPYVAICIPTYNQANHLAQAVLSACNQSYPKVEVWVSDDCSTDHTPQLMKDLMKRYPHCLRYHRHHKNMGICDNANWLLSQPQTEFIARLDSDDFLNPTYIEKLIYLMERYPSAGYAHCSVQEVDNKSKFCRIRRLGSRDEYQDADTSLISMISGYRVAANICLFRATALRMVCYYRSGINFTEDWDLAIRIADAGFGNVYTDHVLAVYRVWVEEVRPERKLKEIAGCISIYEDILIPAFKRRNWSVEPLVQAKKSIAVSQSLILDSPRFTHDQRRQAIYLLEKLGDSDRLRLRIRLLDLGLGPILRAIGKIKLYVRDVVKALLTKYRRMQRVYSRTQ